MHDTEVRPPPGGNVVRGELHPGTGVTGDGEVVGTAETAGVVGVVEVAEEGVVESGAGLFGWRMTGRVAEGVAQEAASRATSTTHAPTSRWVVRPTLACVRPPFPKRETAISEEGE